MSELRSLLKEVVDEPTGTQAEMDAIRVRAGRHAARQRWIAAIVALGVAILGIGAATLMFGGHSATPASRISGPKPSAIPSPPGSQPSNRGTGSSGPARPCTSAQLSGRDDTVELQGAMQSLMGVITVVNHGPKPCWLSGRPRVRIVGRNGPLSLKRTTVVPVGPTVGSRRIAQGQSAVLAIRWSNYCGGSLVLGRIRFEVTLHGGHSPIFLRSNGGGSLPACGAPKYPSTLGVSRWSFPGT